jgi:Family of unknown function (DUF5681)
VSIATPTRCDNRQNWIAEAEEAAYGGRRRRLQGGPRPAAVAYPFPQGAVRQPRRPQQKQLHALLADALNEPAFVTIDGERRQITKREAVVHQLVNKSATADLRATKMLFDMIKEVEQKASPTSPAPEPRRLDAADKEVVQQLVDRIRRQILAEMAAENIAAAGAEET